MLESLSKTPARVFSHELYEILKNAFLTKHLRVTASVHILLSSEA